MMEAELNAKLITLAEEYSRASGLMLSTIAMRAVRDARFFERLSDGKGFNVKTYDRVVRYFADNWPAQADWPHDIERPQIPAPEPERVAS